MSAFFDLTATSSGTKYLLFGMETDKMFSFAIQYYITHYGSRAIDWMASMGLGFCSWMGGELWLHNSDDVDRCNFFGEKKDFKVGIVANQEANRLKVLDSIAIHSEFEEPLDRESKWEVESVTIPSSLNYPNGMYSKIPSNRFEKREGILKAEFLRNMKTNSATANALDALRGEELRAYDALIVLKNSSDGQVKLYKVDVNSTLSNI
jgi:hypothetical protein